MLAPYYHLPGKVPFYYQEISINRAVQAILQGKRRVLLTLATGTGKTLVAFQICWKLWNSGRNRTVEHRKLRTLFLADRNVLVDEPMAKTFAPFGDARHKIEGEAVKSRQMYISTYQAIAKDERRPGLYREYVRFSSTWSSSTNATGAAPGTSPTGGTFWNTSSRPTSSV